MAIRTWKGGKADWYDPGQWITRSPDPNTYPLPGDIVRVGSGVVRLVGSRAKDDRTFDDQTVSLGSRRSGRPAELLARRAFFQIYFDLTTPAGHYARLVTQGTSGFDGSLDVKGHLTIDAAGPDGNWPASFVLTPDAYLTVANAGTLKLVGQVKLETVPGQAVVGAGGSLINDADLSLVGSTFRILAGATLAGSGTIAIGDAGTLDVETASPATQTIAFDGPGGTLKIGGADAFRSPITNFTQGDRIDLETTAADYAAFDGSTGLIDVRSGGAGGVLVASLRVEGPPGGTLAARPDGSGGTIITYAASGPRLMDEIGAGDRAMQSDIVRATMTTSAGAPIDGSGVKIGIISDSFDATGTADTAAGQGYLPYDLQSGTAAVTVLGDDPHGSDEGQAMAELVHQVAPGAELYFCAGGNSPGTMAAAVTALQNAGCSIITDDLGFSNEPYFQVTGGLDQSIERAIGDGVSYFTAASNLGNAFLQSAFDPVSTSLQDAPSQIVSAQRFSNGTPYETITVTGGEELAIDLQWDAAYPEGGNNVPDALVMKLYDMQGNLVATSHQLSLAGATIPEVELDLRAPAALFTNYRLAIVQVDGTPAVGQFSAIMGGYGNGSGPGGYFDDPAAENGAGTTSGHDLVPGANTVGAADWANSQVFGTSGFAEGFSSSGPGELLFDQAGNRLLVPVADGKVNFLAPDGIDVSTPGFQPFFGTSAAAPNAAAVAALMLQANPDLTPAEVTTLLEASAADLGLSTALQGAGFIQANQAVAFAAALASPTLSLDRPALQTDAGSGATLITVSGSSDAVGQTVGIALGGSKSPLATAIVGADGSWSATIEVSALAEGEHRLLAEVQGTGQTSAKAGTAFAAPAVVKARDGATTFVFEPGFEQDTITSFVVGGPRHDAISLPEGDATRLGAILAAATTNAAGATTLYIDRHDAITLAGVSLAELDQHRRDFTFHV